MTFGNISPAYASIAPSALELKLAQAQTTEQAAPRTAIVAPARSSGRLDTVA